MSKAYKKSILSTMYTIDTEAKIIAQDLKLDERIGQTTKSNNLLR